MTIEVSELGGSGGTREQRALVLHPDIRGAHHARDANTALNEALSLAMALPGIEVVGSMVVRLPRALPAMLFGSGKVDEIKGLIEADEVDLVLVDGPLSPVQQRNLETAWDIKVLDRTGLILEIFADRARTREGVLQVELAALSYQRTRLVRAWTHLERQRGGFGFVGGPGETQLEADRRAIDVQVVRLRKQLEKVAQTRELHRAARRRIPYPVVALVGYTNAGKSTLFNRLTGAEVMVKDMLFATLDPTMRAVTLPGGLQVILSDTVGFISNLPTQLIAAFRATLEEVLEADLILHVRDIAHPETEAQAHDVETILADLGVNPEVPKLEVWNKIDLLPADDPHLNIADRRETVVAASALTGRGFEDLIDAVGTALGEVRWVESVDLGHEQGRARAWAYEEGIVLSEETAGEGITLTLSWSPRQKRQFETLLVSDS
ncbi:GTPase HflX [Pararhodobacter oceanensis]|uniref:GTPase HflX n=1 Tax=Pararhodobacter oceanensis TaxID=2172121 RepID=UPI001402F563|nr:GTPase HflX [Pararhodobacter oceanensis]